MVATHGCKDQPLSDNSHIHTKKHSMCHEQQLNSTLQQPASTRPDTSSLPDAALSQDGVHATCEPLPAPRKFNRQAVLIRSGQSSAPQEHTAFTNGDFKRIASCKAALGRSIATEEPALWERDSAVNACLGMALVL